jgi:hypothetical protein
MIENWYAPNGARIESTLEKVEGTCGILGIDPKTGEPER